MNEQRGEATFGAAIFSIGKINKKITFGGRWAHFFCVDFLFYSKWKSKGVGSMYQVICVTRFPSLKASMTHRTNVVL